LKFLKHENFPDAIANLIRHFEYWCYGETTVQFPVDLYPEETEPGAWLLVVGKQAVEHRPTILTVDAGTGNNAVALKALRDTKCSFVFLSRKWRREESLPEFSWKMLRVWPEIVERARDAHNAKRQVRIDVTPNGERRPRVDVTNY